MKDRFYLRAFFACAVIFPGLSLAQTIEDNGDSSAYELNTPFQTRFGTMDINNSNELLLNGIPFNPDVTGSFALDLNAVLQVGDHDIAIVTDVGGQACPTLFYVIDLSAAGSHAKGTFGSCGDLVSISKQGNSVYIIEHGYEGPFESQADQNAAYATLKTFKYANGQVTLNGQVQPNNPP